MSTDVILFDPRYRTDLKSGRKRCTIRLGKRNLRPGEIRKAACGDDELALHIQEVEFKRVDQLTGFDAQKDGFRNVQDLLSTLGSYYPGLHPSDWLTIVTFQIMGKIDNE
jgi:hypothetical protein